MSNTCIYMLIPASTFVSLWVSVQIRREPHHPRICENIKTVCSIPARYCPKRPFTVNSKPEKRSIIWSLQEGHLTQLTDFLLVFCSCCFKKVSLTIGFTVFEPDSFKAYSRLVCFLWRVMFSEVFLYATSRWREINCVLILQILLHLLDFMFLWGGEGAREREANNSAGAVWCYWRERERHACQLSPGLIFLDVISGTSGWDWQQTSSLKRLWSLGRWASTHWFSTFHWEVAFLKEEICSASINEWLQIVMLMNL